MRHFLSYSANKRVIYTFDSSDKDSETVMLPMTIDTDGNLWVGLYYGGLVLKIDPW